MKKYYNARSLRKAFREQASTTASISQLTRKSTRRLLSLQVEPRPSDFRGQGPVSLQGTKQIPRSCLGCVALITRIYLSHL